MDKIKKIVTHVPDVLGAWQHIHQPAAAGSLKNQVIDMINADKDHDGARSAMQQAAVAENSLTELPEI